MERADREPAELTSWDGGWGVHLRGADGEDGRDGGQAAAVIEVLLDRSGDEEALDDVDHAVWANHCVRVDHGGKVDPIAEEVDVVGYEGAMASGFGYRPGIIAVPGGDHME
ncbi:hypothetical protein COCNU_08G005480 [Cocos nucifera]|uniref:Uncharacterized protein n=1 Tax=Cocos nucifera TaxID=13894 RepID=A0A8K0II25_COCNU|nr:hypothetical protein COCNU_08G005480 [Cocos nucifera]